MTVLTKPSLVIKKPDCTKSPLVEDNAGSDEEKVDIYPPTSLPHYHAGRHRSAGALFCMSIVALLVAITGVSCGLMLYKQYLRSTGVHRYQRFCSIPIESDNTDQLIEPNYNEQRVMPLKWSQEPDIQVFNVGMEEPLDSVARSLREEFDVGNRMETIRVYDNGRLVSFIHDFDDNVTGIIDQDRCFMMDLDRSFVMAPEMLVVGMENGEEFDVTRIRSTLRAVMPALAEMVKRASALAERCLNKPTYKLERLEGVVIRKRAVDAPPHDYIQFSGKGIQEIQITNLGDLLQSEQVQA
ncbi:hypothetical protein O0L34_g1587 [Tuta absoluta]|nr:hypothetical protein O0L34_g1587 [Tuta absoluta]